MSKSYVQSVLGLMACAALATPVAAATPPPAQGSIRFEEFEAPDGTNITSCDKHTIGPDSSSCSGLTVYTGGPLGDGFHVSGQKSGTGAITSVGSDPKVSATLDMSGGDSNAGAGIAEVDTQFEYYVTVLPLGSLGTSGLLIPLTFTDAGAIHGGGSNAEIIGEASTTLAPFMGDITVDGGPSSVNDGLDDTSEGSVLDESYSHTHHLIFDFSEGDTVARVSLAATCSAGAVAIGGMSADCSAFADPAFAFDQAAFDAMMGPHTFSLSDAFQIALSPGLAATGGGIPEPASWALMIAGFGLAGAMLRRRRALTA
jgi:hypothetical protein